MAKTKTLGSAIVRFISQGVGKLKAEIATVQGAVTTLATTSERQQRRMAREAAAAAKAAQATKRYWDDLAGSFTAVGTRALATFGIATAAAGGFLRMADPRGMDLLTIAFGKLAIQIGRFFVPAVREVTAWVERSVAHLKNLSDATRETIYQWFVWGTTALATVGTLGIAGGMVLRIVGHLSILGHTLGRVSKALAAIGVAPWIVGLVAAGVAIAAFTGQMTGFGDHAIALWQSMESLFGAVAEAIKPFLAALGTLTQALLPVIVPLITVLVDALTTLVTALSSVVEWLGASGLAGIAVAAAILMLPAILARVVVGFWSLVVAAGAASGGIRALGASLLRFVSSPWNLAFTGIAAAIGLLVAAFSSATDGVDRLAARMTRLAEMRRRLAAGGTVSRDDVRDSLSAEDAAAYFRARTPGERAAVLDGVRTRAEGEIRSLPSADEGMAREATLRHELVTALRDRGTGESLRDFASGALTRAGLSPDLVSGLGSTEESIDSFISAHGPTARRRAAEARIEVARAGSDGRNEGEDRFRGEARAPKADFVGILDLARRMQTASGEDPSTALAREALGESRRTRELTETIRDHTAALPRMRGVVPGST